MFCERTSLLLLISLLVLFINAQSTYKAAVVEFSPRVSAYSAPDLLLVNAALYITYIENAANLGVEIIVFPEDGLTGLNIWADATEETITNHSTFVPDPQDEIAPCDDTNLQNYTKALVDLSCSARTNSIYLVINVLERANGTDNSTILYNTDIVFDRNGVVIARYRKINLFYEPFVTPGNTTVTFQTDFGVKFAIFTCFDIVFKNPSLEVLNDASITDVIYTVAWFSEVPFLQSLSVQAGYARANGLNLLASGLSNATNGNGGSGIYLANGTIAEIYLSAASASKMIIQDIPIVSERVSSCEVTPIEYPTGVTSHTSIGFISNFKNLIEDLSNYTSSNLDLTADFASINLCSEGSSFCCNFEVSIDTTTSNSTTLVYKLVVFNGNRRLAESSSGNQICGIVGCLTDDIQSCGERRREPVVGVKFLNINITGVFTDSPNGFSQPSTLTYSLSPIQNYTYCRQSTESGAAVSLNLTSPLENLFAFGIYGRVYTNDGGVIGKSTASFSTLCTVSVFLLSLLTFLEQRIIS